MDVRKWLCPQCRLCAVWMTTALKMQRFPPWNTCRERNSVFTGSLKDAKQTLKPKFNKKDTSSLSQCLLWKLVRIFKTKVSEQLFDFFLMFCWKCFVFLSHFLSHRAVTTPISCFFTKAGVSLWPSETADWKSGSTQQMSKEGINLLKMPRTASFDFSLSLFFFYFKSFREDPKPNPINRMIQRAFWTWNC